MSSVFSQSLAVILMNFRSIPRRIWMSVAMIVASAVVVAILLAFLAMAKGFEITLQSAGKADVALMLRTGSGAELNSSLSKEHVDLLRLAPGVVSNQDGPVASPELYVIVDGKKKSTNTDANLPMRGVHQKQAVPLRTDFVLIDGRMFEDGVQELIVGRGVLDQFNGFELGSTLRFGKSEWKVVGVFSAGGTVYESELWADARVVQSQYNRGSGYNSLRMQLSSPEAIEQVQAYIESEPRLNPSLQTDADYFAEQGRGLQTIASFGWVVSIVMSLGALAGALNTMYTSVSERSKEIATLRAIGFSHFSAFVGTLFEALLLAAMGGLLGAFAAFVLFDGLSASTLGGSFTQVVFSFELSPDLFWQGASLALVIGFLSGFFPAWRAARVPVIVAFQSGR